MSGIDLDVEVDMGEVGATLDRLGIMLEEKMSIAVKGSAAMVAATAKQTRSFKDRDGRLRGSIRGTEAHSDGDTIQADVIAGGMEVYYAPYIEFGTAKITPRRFMRDAYESHLVDMEMLMTAAVDAAIAEVGLAP